MFSFIFPRQVPVTDKKTATERPDLTNAVADARRALLDNDPNIAMGTLAPWLNDNYVPSEVLYVTGRSLMILGRNPESLGYMEKFLERKPRSFAGLIVAGITASRMSEFSKATGWITDAVSALRGNAKNLLMSVMAGTVIDPIDIEEMVVEVESYPGDDDRRVALLCALCIAGHYRAAERFLDVVDRIPAA